MSEAKRSGEPALSKTETAELVAHWATQELGFRKPSTLVSTKGEDKLTAADIEPLLQGELAVVLEQLATHIVSSKKSAQCRSTLASYSAQHQHPTETKGRPAAYLTLRKTLNAIYERENALLSDINGVEMENLKAIKTIDDLEARRVAMQSRIKELRLRILVKRAMTEKINRLSERMKLLIRETKLACGGSRAAVKTESLFDLLDSIQAQAKGDNASVLLDPGSDRSAHEQRQALIASLITDIKSLVDKHIQTCDSLKLFEPKLAVQRTQLADKIEAISSRLSTEAVFAGDETCDYKCPVLQLILENIQSHVRTQVSAFVPDLVVADPCVWDKCSHREKVCC
ncbi:hypothetical protein J3B02_006169 [Coemansia erecta]|nr:hypothetical protein J3B02_006169 [Coemansia erecta]